MIQNLVGIIIFTLIGCNWNFMAHNDSLDLIFPTKISDYLTQASNRDYRDIKVPGIQFKAAAENEEAELHKKVVVTTIHVNHQCVAEAVVCQNLMQTL